MPLRSCPECNAKISTDAKKCPQCGCHGDLTIYSGARPVLYKHLWLGLIPSIIVTALGAVAVFAVSKSDILTIVFILISMWLTTTFFAKRLARSF